MYHFGQIPCKARGKLVRNKRSIADNCRRGGDPGEIIRPRLQLRATKLELAQQSYDQDSERERRAYFGE